ncbi:hypothetical protein F5Y19DRAFT_155033 [Xylariaceae sp. FL1651]|nr:hypothetical protein F5Y19DRAFT_155033 [Xylariaceae sp. FL1651]
MFLLSPYFHHQTAAPRSDTPHETTADSLYNAQYSPIESPRSPGKLSFLPYPPRPPTPGNPRPAPVRPRPGGPTPPPSPRSSLVNYQGFGCSTQHLAILGCQFKPLLYPRPSRPLTPGPYRPVPLPPRPNVPTPPPSPHRTAGPWISGLDASIVVTVLEYLSLVKSLCDASHVSVGIVAEDEPATIEEGSAHNRVTVAKASSGHSNNPVPTAVIVVTDPSQNLSPSVEQVTPRSPGAYCEIYESGQSLCECDPNKILVSDPTTAFGDDNPAS